MEINNNINKHMLKRSLLVKRTSVLPEEYPELETFLLSINKTMWFVNKWDFSSDKNDFNNFMSFKEKTVAKRALLAIAQVEIKVKRFWADLYNMFPKPEIDAIGVSFAESEVRHSRGYRKPIEVFGLQEEFEDLENVACIADRIKYLEKYLLKVKEGNPTDQVMALTLFSLAIENSSLFGLFSILKNINKEKGYLKDTDNVIMDTTKEENIHALFGIYIINLLKEENPEIFPEDFSNIVKNAMIKSYESESRIIDWVFEHGDLEYLEAEQVKNYIKFRINYSLELLNIDKIFDIKDEDIEKFDFFELEQASTIHVDFFHKTSPNYNKHAHVATTNDLF